MADTPQFRDRSRAARRSGAVSGRRALKKMSRARLVGGPALAPVVGSGALLALAVLSGPTVAAPELQRFLESQSGATAGEPTAAAAEPSFGDVAAARPFAPAPAWPTAEGQAPRG